MANKRFSFSQISRCWSSANALSVCMCILFLIFLYSCFLFLFFFFFIHVISCSFNLADFPCCSHLPIRSKNKLSLLMYISKRVCYCMERCIANNLQVTRSSLVNSRVHAIGTDHTITFYVGDQVTTWQEFSSFCNGTPPYTRAWSLGCTKKPHNRIKPVFFFFLSALHPIIFMSAKQKIQCYYRTNLKKAVQYFVLGKWYMV